MSKSAFQERLVSLINSESMENGSDTPDFILAQYLVGCLENFNAVMALREKWYGRLSDDHREYAHSPYQHHKQGRCR